MRYWCVDANMGYSQYDRWDFDPSAGNCDCSSLVIHCLQEAGFDTGDATYTGNLSANLTARGWARVAADGDPQAGDILLNDADHVAVYLGGGMLAQASISENNSIAGNAGDQTGWETNVSAYYNYPWDCYLRYAGESEENDMTIDELYGAKGNDGRNLWDEVIENRNQINALRNDVAHLVWAYKNANVNGERDAYDLLTKMPHDVMDYKNSKMNGDKDVYQLITDLGTAVADLTAKVDALSKGAANE
nr:NlpC/P60 family protein [Bifidobacterium sp. DSM 109963]